MSTQVCINLIESDTAVRTPVNSVTQFLYSAPEGYYWKYASGPTGIKVTNEENYVGAKYTSITSFMVTCSGNFGSGQLVFNLIEEDNDTVAQQIKVTILS